MKTYRFQFVVAMAVLGLAGLAGCNRSQMAQGSETDDLYFSAKDRPVADFTASVQPVTGNRNQRNANPDYSSQYDQQTRQNPDAAAVNDTYYDDSYNADQQVAGNNLARRRNNNRYGYNSIAPFDNFGYANNWGGNNWGGGGWGNNWGGGFHDPFWGGSGWGNNWGGGGWGFDPFFHGSAWGRPGFNVSIGWGGGFGWNRWNNWGGGGFYDPFWGGGNWGGGGWGWNNGWGGGWNRGWGNNVWVNNNYYNGGGNNNYYGGGNNGGNNNGGNNDRPNGRSYGSRSDRGTEAVNRNVDNTPRTEPRGGRTDASQTYARPERPTRSAPVYGSQAATGREPVTTDNQYRSNGRTGNGSDLEGPVRPRGVQPRDNNSRSNDSFDYRSENRSSRTENNNSGSVYSAPQRSSGYSSGSNQNSAPQYSAPERSTRSSSSWGGNSGSSNGGSGRSSSSGNSSGSSGGSSGSSNSGRSSGSSSGSSSGGGVRPR